MKSNKRIAVLLGLASVLAFTALPAPAFYNPSTGRWLSRDPAGKRGGPNPYGLCANRPVGYVDAVGLWPRDTLEGLACLPCKCRFVEVTYDPGGSQMGQLAWYHHDLDWRFGTQITVRWDVLGNPHRCHYWQDETGTEELITGPVPFKGKGGIGERAQVYTDDMGAPFPLRDPGYIGTYTIAVTWRATFRCISEDGTVVERKDSADFTQSFNYPP